MYCKANAKFVNDGFITEKNGALILKTGFFCTARHEMVRNQACVHQNRERGLGVMGASDNCDARFCVDEEGMRVGKKTSNAKAALAHLGNCSCIALDHLLPA